MCNIFVYYYLGKRRCDPCVIFKTLNRNLPTRTLLLDNEIRFWKTLLVNVSVSITPWRSEDRCHILYIWRQSGRLAASQFSKSFYLMCHVTCPTVYKGVPRDQETCVSAAMFTVASLCLLATVALAQEPHPCGRSSCFQDTTLNE